MLEPYQRRDNEHRATGAPRDALFAVADLEFGYSRDTVLRIPRLDLPRGLLIGLMGPNGAGKSSLLRLLAGLARPRRGSVRVSGSGIGSPAEVSRLAPRQRAKMIAWLPQRFEGQFPWTVREMVATGRHPHLRQRWTTRPEDRAVVDAALARCALTPLAERPIESVSGGEWQRAAIARSLVQEAEVLLLDEPVANLDVRFQRDIYQHLSALTREQGKTIVVADHHFDLLSAYCDALVLLDGGQVVAEGSPPEVLRAERLETVFRTPVEVLQDPRTGRPRVAWRLGRTE